jgi:hypothetical protein
MHAVTTGMTRQRPAERPLGRPWRFLSQHRWTILVVAAISLFGWPYGSIAPGVNGDWNWIASLSWAADHGLRFGDRIVWTYGPLGFMDSVPVLYYADVALAAVAFQAVVQVLLAGTVYLAARRSFPAIVAVLIAFLVATLVSERALVLGFAWCVLTLTRREDAPRDLLARVFPPAIGALAALLLLGKLNHGVAIGVLAVIALVASPTRARTDAAWFAGSLSLTATVAWFLTGQTVSDVWPYLHYGLETISGYPAAMGLGDRALAWHYWAAALVVVIASALIWQVARVAGPHRRWGLVLLWVAYLYLDFKAGFTRHDIGHAPLFFGDVLVALAILPVAASQRAFALAGIGATAILVGAASGPFDFGRELSPLQNARAAVLQARTLVDSSRAEESKRVTRDGIKAHYQLPPELLAQLAGNSVAFWPGGLGSVAWAYQLNWRPLPVIESYSAYTPKLDQLGADMLASSRAPERMVRAVPGRGVPPTPLDISLAAIDNRYATFEAPLTTLAIVCRYRQLPSVAPYQLLARANDRCGTQREVGRVAARWGGIVTVPQVSRRSLLLVRVEGTQPWGVERLTAQWLRPAGRSISLGGVGHKLVWRTAQDGLLLRAAPRVDYPVPFTLAPDPPTITITRDGDDEQPRGTLHYTFFEVPVDADGKVR